MTRSPLSTHILPLLESFQKRTIVNNTIASPDVGITSKDFYQNLSWRAPAALAPGFEIPLPLECLDRNPSVSRPLLE